MLCRNLVASSARSTPRVRSENQILKCNVLYPSEKPKKSQVDTLDLPVGYCPLTQMLELKANHIVRGSILPAPIKIITTVPMGAPNPSFLIHERFITGMTPP